MSWFDFAFLLLIFCCGVRGRLGSSELLWPKPNIIAIFKQRHTARIFRDVHCILKGLQGGSGDPQGYTETVLMDELVESWMDLRTFRDLSFLFARVVSTLFAADLCCVVFANRFRGQLVLAFAELSVCIDGLATDYTPVVPARFQIGS